MALLALFSWDGGNPHEYEFYLHAVVAEGIDNSERRDVLELIPLLFVHSLRGLLHFWYTLGARAFLTGSRIEIPGSVISSRLDTNED